MVDISGKTAWVTGGGSGIGRGMALALAAAGVNVALTGRRRDALEETADLIAASTSAKTRVVPADVTDRSAVSNSADEIIGHFDGINILCNNHGTNVTERSWQDSDTALDDWEHVLDVNVKGAWNCVAAVLPGMRDAGDGLIFNTGSWAGRFYSPVAGVAYGASKHAIMSMNALINREEGANGIRACVICPAEVATPILDRRPQHIDAETRAQYLQPGDLGELVVSVAQLNPRACVNEILVSPTAFQK